MAMKITLDHNCILDLENRTEVGLLVEAIVLNKSNQCFVVNIGASEMRKKGVRPDNYQRFEELLLAARIDHLPRLNPIAIWDLTFWDTCVWADDGMIRLSQDIELALFGDVEQMDIAKEGLDSLTGRKWVNRQCDIHTMWCHIQNGNEVFLTTDANFTKKTKLQRLIVLGAGRICHPRNL